MCEQFRELRPRAYVDGVFDLFHSGHLEFLRRAREAAPPGAELWVGVITDESAKWKRLPVVPHAQRVAMLQHCTLVDRVVADPPLILTDEFLDAHRIACVLHGDDDRQEMFFAAPIRRGIMKYVRYTAEGPLAATTTGLIARVKARALEGAP